MNSQNKADILRIHIQRWVEANRERLTPEQLAVTREWRAFTSSDNYREPVTEARRSLLKEIEGRSAAVFSKEEIKEALTIYGTYIPKEALK